MNFKPNSRRNFLKMILAAPAVVAFSNFAFAQEKKKKKGDASAPAGDGHAVPGQGAAATIKYVEDKSKVAKADQVTKGGVTFDKQDCHNCILFQGGKCTIITDSNKIVKPTGWCPTWTHNPAVKA